MINLDLTGIPVDVSVNAYDPKDPWYQSTLFGIPLYIIGAAGLFYFLVKK
jgi:hypothetical protein